MDLPASQTSLEPHANTLTEQLNENPGSYFIKSWPGIHNHACMHLHLFYNSITQSFSVILQSPNTYELIPSTKNGFDLIKVPILDCKATKNKLMSLSPLKLVQFLRKELRYPLIRGDKHDYTVQLNIGGLLGGGAKVSRVSAEVKEQNFDQGSNTYLHVYDFLIERYAIRVTKNNDSKDEVLIDKLATRICNALPTGQILDVDKILGKGIDACEEEFFEEVVLEVLGKSLEEGRLELTDYTRSFSSGKLCIELLRKVYFARERGKGGVSKLIVEKVLAKVGKETESVIAKFQKKTEDKSAKDKAAKDKPVLGKVSNKDKKEVNFERALMVLETQDKLTSLLEPLSKIKHRKVMNFIKHKLNLETDDSKEILNACCFADNGDEICEQIINDVLSTKLEVGSSSILPLASPTTLRNEILSAKSPNKSVLVSEVSSPDIKPKEAKTSKRLPYMDKVRLSVLSELNLLEHDLTTLVELHNMLKADISAQNANSGTTFQGNSNTRSSKLSDFRNLIMDIIRTYKENESTLADEQLSSLLPLAFVQDTEVFRAFLEAFLQDFSNDILFEVKKVRMLSFIIISALRNPDFKDYLQVDDLIRCLKILKPKIEDLSITSGNLNLQEAISSLNDILYLMGFIGAKGVKGDYLEMVKDLTTHMQTHGLEKAFNVFSRKGTDPSLAIKREYALEAFKRIEGTSFENWTENCAKILQVTQIAVNIGKGLFLGDMTSICTALMQIKDMAMDAYANMPRTWFIAANELKFLAEEPLEKIIKEVFRTNQKQNENFSFYVAELMLLVVKQNNRKPKEKRAIIQALWCLVNGYDYKQCKAQRYLVRSRTFRPNKNLGEYAKVTLLAIAESADMDLAIFIRKIVETPIKITSLDNNQADFKINIKQNEEEVKQEEEDVGRLFYWKVLKEKKPKLYALAKIQEHSAKTLDKPTVMIEFRGINGEKDFDDNFVRKLTAKIDNSKDRKFLDDLVKAVDALDPKTATKKSITDLFDKDGSTEIVRSEEDKELKTVKNDLREKTKSKIDKMKDGNALMLLDALPVFLNDPSKKVWLIQGDAGTGKSLLLRLMEQKLWKRYDILVKADTKSKNRLPLRIVLSEVRNFDKAVDEFLLKHGCDQDGINDIKREPTVILFDGYDEINQFINLYNQNKLETWTDVKVIFTSRKENLTALKEDYIFCFTPGKDKTKVLSYSILGVNEEQIRKFFDAQAQENVQQIEKLEKKLTTFVGKNLNAPPITEAVRRTIERWENFPSSAKYKWLVEFIATLEEGMPDVEEFQKDLDALKSDTVEIKSLTEIFQEYIADLKNVINPTTIKAVISKIEHFNQSIQNTENQLANLKCDTKRSTINDINTSIQYLKKLTTLKKISKSLTNLDEHVKKALSIEDVGKKDISSYWGSSSAQKELTDLIALVTPEKFKEKAEPARANIQEMKVFGNEIATAMNTESKDSLFEFIENQLNKVEQFSDFDKLKTVLEKLQKTLKEFIVIEGDFECLYAKENVVQGQEKENEKEIENDNLAQAQGQEKGQQPQEEQQQIQEKQEQKDSSYQGNIQPTQAAEQVEQLPDLEKLKSLIPKLEEIRNAYEECCKELVFLEDFRKNYEELDTFFKTANNGSVPAVEKIENKYKKFSQWGKFWSDYESFIRTMFVFMPSTYTPYLVRQINAPIKQLKELMYLWEMQAIFKTLEENVNGVHLLIQEVRYPKNIKEDSKLIQALQKQLTVLQTSADQDKAQPSISKLDEMIQEIKGLENEFAAIKDASTEQTMAIRTTKNDIERLQEFADPLKLDSIITKFKDILTSPFMVKMLLETLTKFPSETANKAELYRLFANIHFEREKDKMLRTEKVPPKFNVMDSFYHYSKDLAVNMFFRKVTSIHAKSHGYKAVGFVETIKAHMWSRFFDDSDILTKLARRGAQIIEDEGVIRFMHRSIMEYFTARYFFDEIVDYDPDQSEDYDPSLNRGLIVETETDVYQFLMHLTDSQEKTRQKKESEKGQKGMTVLEKKILEVLGSPHLRNQYGTNFENNFFYQNVFLILLLDLSLATKIAELKEDSAVVSTIDSIFRWIFNPSGTSHKFVEAIRRAAIPGDTNLYQILQPLVHMHYHIISKPNSGIKFDDPPANSTNQLKVRLFIKSGSPSLIVKDGVIVEAKDKTAHSWTLDIKLFVYGSQENIVILSSEAGCFAVKSLEEQNAEKKSAANKNEKNEKNGKKGGNETLKAFVLNKNQTPWNVRECKWILRMSQDSLIEFALQSMSDPSKILFGGFKSVEEYNMQFKDVCSNDVTVGYFSCTDKKAYLCETCNMVYPDLICESCKDQCHKGHKVVKSDQTYGICYCQVSGSCGIARGCTAKLETFIQDEIKYMFKCNQCPDSKKNTVLCVGCKKHHEKDHSHRDFAKIERVGGERIACECNCISNRTKLIASCPQYGYGGYNNFSERGVNIPKAGNMDDDEGDDDQDN